MAFGCPRCGRVSQNPNDEAMGYCVACHDVTGNERAGLGQLPLLDVFELRYLLSKFDPAEPLYTAVAEAIVHARSERHARATALLRSLARLLAEMKVSTVSGTPPVDGFKIFARALEAMEGFVRDHGTVEEHAGEARSDERVLMAAEPPQWMIDLLGPARPAPPT
jgi:hypothetical protein